MTDGLQHDRSSPPAYNPWADGHPAKLWELLRRNADFGELAQRIVNLSTSQNADDRFKAHSEIWRIWSTHPFAATALEWLGPDTTFRFTFCDRVDGFDQQGKACKFDLQWEGTTPNVPPITDPAWQVMDDVPRVNGRVIRVGPTIWQTDRDSVDQIQQWREDARDLPPFSLASSWRNTPKTFRWQFAYQWRHSSME